MGLEDDPILFMKQKAYFFRGLLYISFRECRFFVCVLFFCCPIFSTFFFNWKQQYSPTLPTLPGSKFEKRMGRISKCQVHLLDFPNIVIKGSELSLPFQALPLRVFHRQSWEILQKFLVMRMKKKRVEMKSDEIPGILPRKLTWNMKIIPLKRKIIFQTSIFGFRVSFRGCKLKYCKWWRIPESSKKVWTLNPLNPLKNRPSRGADIGHPWEWI